MASPFRPARLAALIASLSVSLCVLAPGAGAQSAAPDVPRFEIARYRVEGNVSLSPEVLERVLAPHAGSGRDFGDIQRAVAALEAAYREAGYPMTLVQLPEQEIQSGVVTLKVVERRLGQVTVEGNQHFSTDNIRRSLPGLQPGQPPRLGEVSQSLRVANDNPAKKATLELQNAPDGEQVDARVRVSDASPWRIGASLDNTGTDETGKTRIGVLLQHANVADRDQVLTFQYSTSPEKPSQVAIYSVGYHLPLYDWGDAIDLYAGYSDVDSGSVTAGVLNFNVSGRGALFGAHYDQSLPRLGDYEQRLVYAFDYRDFDSDIGYQGVPLGSRVTVRPLSLTYAGKWSRAASEAGFYLGASSNLAGGAHGSDADFNLARAGASPHYSLWRYGANFRTDLPAQWQLGLQFNGQYTSDMLVPGEQFGVGGAYSVRGFEEREFANDRGVALSAEVYTPELCAGLAGSQCRVLAFYDAGHLSRVAPLPGEASSTTVSSAGLGLRLAAGAHAFLRMDAARVIEDGGTGSSGDARIHFLLGLNY